MIRKNNIVVLVLGKDPSDDVDNNVLANINERKRDSILHQIKIYSQSVPEPAKINSKIKSEGTYADVDDMILIEMNNENIVLESDTIFCPDVGNSIANDTQKQH